MLQLRFGFYNQLTKAGRDILEESLFKGKDWLAYQAMYLKAKNELDLGLEFEKKEFFKLMNAAAEGGDLDAMQSMANYYYDGARDSEPDNPKKRDIRKAWYWLRRQWEALGCQGEPYTEDRDGRPWRKPGKSEDEYRKPKTSTSTLPSSRPTGPMAPSRR